MYKPSNFIVIIYVLTELVTKVTSNINSVEVHPRLSNNRCPVDGALVRAGSLWPQRSPKTKWWHQLTNVVQSSNVGKWRSVMLTKLKIQPDSFFVGWCSKIWPWQWLNDYTNGPMTSLLGNDYKRGNLPPNLGKPHQESTDPWIGGEGRGEREWIKGVKWAKQNKICLDLLSLCINHDHFHFLHDIVKVLYTYALPTWPSHYPFICKLNFVVRFLAHAHEGRSGKKQICPLSSTNPGRQKIPTFCSRSPFRPAQELGSSFLGLCSSFSRVSSFTFLLTCLVLEVPVSQWFFFLAKFCQFSTKKWRNFWIKKKFQV
jgi:hypothetical protein